MICFYDEQVKGYGMFESCNTNGGCKKCGRFWSEDLKEKSEYLRLGWRIIIKLDVKNTLGGGICVSIGSKSDGFSQQLSCCNVLKKLGN